MSRSIRGSQVLLTSAVGIVMLIFGVSQITRPRRWLSYLPPLVAKLLPVAPETAIRTHGSINFLLGAWLLAKPTRLSASTAGLWWLSVASLCARREGWQTGMRDVAIAAALAAVALDDDDFSVERTQ